MPLGAVTAERVARARGVALAIQRHLEAAAPRSAEAVIDLTRTQSQLANEQRVWDAQLERLSTDFFLQMPSVDASIIATAEAASAKLAMLDLLGDIALTQKLLRQKKRRTKTQQQGAAAAAGAGAELHPLDEKYASLSCSMRALGEGDAVRGHVAAMLANTAAPLTSSRHLCGFKGPGGGRASKNAPPPRVLRVFELSREGEPEEFEREHGALGNRRLLWHGTDVATAAAICATGLRIMPNAGGRCGKGIYLADEANKSGYYVRPTAEGVGVMFLAEAALGKSHVIARDSSTVNRYAAGRLPTGCDSVVALGKSVPDPAADIALELDGKEVALACGALTRRRAAELGGGATFEQTEYLVYRESQARLRYLVTLQLW